MPDITVAALLIYPIKSTRGISVESAAMGPRGFEHDRRFMLVDTAGVFLSQRTHPQMALLRTAFDGDNLVIEAEGGDCLRVPLTPREDPSRRRPVQIWSDSCEGVDVGPEANTFLSNALGSQCSLIYMPDSIRRYVNPKYATTEDDIVSFADGYPYLIVGDASLDDVNERLTRSSETAVPMDRFRPNIVLSGSLPFEEDGWRTVTIGDYEFSVVKPCDRCVTITVDQRTGVSGHEPLAVLARYRKRENRIYFGQNAIAKGPGVLRVGARVQVTSMR
jgi:uncharacterized protein